MSKQLTDGTGRAVKPDGIAIGTCLSCKVSEARRVIRHAPGTVGFPDWFRVPNELPTAAATGCLLQCSELSCRSRFLTFDHWRCLTLVAQVHVVPHHLHHIFLTGS